MLNKNKIKKYLLHKKYIRKINYNNKCLKIRLFIKDFN